MFSKLAVVLLALSSPAFSAAAGKKCTKSTVTSTKTTTAPAVTATPGPIFEVIGYPQQLCGAPQVAKQRDSPSIQIVELVYNPAAGHSNCGKLNGSAQSFSFSTVASPPLVAVPSGCQLIFYVSDACYNDQGSSNVMASDTGECFNKNARSVQLYC